MSTIIGVVNEKGGVGKTTIAVHLAAYFELANDPEADPPVTLDVALVDCDMQRSGSGWFASERRSAAVKDAGGVSPVSKFYTAPDPRDVSKTIHRAANENDIVIVDGPAGLQEATQQIIYISDLLILPVGMSVLETFATSQAVETIDAARMSILSKGGRPPASFLALTRVNPRTTIGKELREALEQLNTPILDSELHYRHAYTTAAQEECTVWDLPKSKAEAASDQMWNLCEEVASNAAELLKERGEVMR